MHNDAVDGSHDLQTINGAHSILEQFAREDFAMQKRLFVPSWWANCYAGIDNGSEQLGTYLRRTTLQGPPLPLVAPLLLATLWHHLSLFALDQPDAGEATVRFRFATKDNASRAKQLRSMEVYFAQPFQVFETDILNGEERRRGNINFLRSAYLEGSDDAIKAHFVFQSSVGAFIKGTDVASQLSSRALGVELISLASPVLTALGANSKRFTAYLQWELARQRAILSNNHSTNHLSTFKEFEEASKALPNVVKDSKLLYEHGLLSWNDESPRQSISAITRTLGKRPGSILFVQRCSEVSRRATELEASVCGVGTSPPKGPEIPTQSAPTNYAAPIHSAKKPKANGESKKAPIEDDFLRRVEEFYASLTPTQRQSFERERSRMTPEQFKRYFTPVLKQRH